MGARGPKPLNMAEAWQQLLSRSIRNDKGCLIIPDGYSVGIGYKKIRADGKDWYIHILSYTYNKGEILSGTVIRHSCDEPSCFNPEHLIAGTHADNVADKVAKKRHGFGERHYRSKLTMAQVKEIRASTKTYAELGRIYGISRGGIYNIKNGTSWQTEEKFNLKDNELKIEDIK